MSNLGFLVRTIARYQSIFHLEKSMTESVQSHLSKTILRFNKVSIYDWNDSYKNEFPKKTVVSRYIRSLHHISNPPFGDLWGGF